ncbi:hypothetical protein B4135_0054 [Caldibacillus debilis]|uniref:Uncharacterized protein n=1 Tax=Caldibacillus debilis TaxID=301148 RepID=A0A150M2L8_9BACI|nr:hypothetical protein B4135_0054 [Caldibacillus debilis]
MDLILSRRRPTNFGCSKPVRPYVLPIFIHLPRETGLTGELSACSAGPPPASGFFLTLP